MNAGLFLAAGEWIAPMDDDDELTPTHVEDLVRFAHANRLEFVWSKAVTYMPGGLPPLYIGNSKLESGQVSHGSVLYSMGLSDILYSPTSYEILEASDWNLWKRIRRAGARMGYLDEVTYMAWRAGHGQYET